MTSMLNTDSVQRGVWSAAVFFGISYLASGGAADFTEYAKVAALQGASVLGSDAVHNWAQMNPSAITSGAVTALVFMAGSRALNGDNEYLTNAGLSFLSEFTERVVANKVYASGTTVNLPVSAQEAETPAL